MRFRHLFFGFEGRITRLQFWIGVATLFVLSAGVGAGLFAIETVLPATALLQAPWGLELIASLVLLWPTLAIYVKRWHDRNRTGWFAALAVAATFIGTLLPFLAMVSLVAEVLILVDLGILDGTPAANRFGPSPKGRTADTSAPGAVAVQVVPRAW